MNYRSSVKSECTYCHKEVYFEYTELNTRWKDDDIPDEDLSDIEVLYRLNNEAPFEVTCPACGESWKVL